ncbi:MAG: hypothetical protein ABI353_08500 [Isosphaeraceae bacterium]
MRIIMRHLDQHSVRRQPWLVLLGLLLAPTLGRAADPIDPQWRLPLTVEDLAATRGKVSDGPSDGPRQFRWTVSLSGRKPKASLTIPTKDAKGADLLVFLEAKPGKPLPLQLTLSARDGQDEARELVTAKEDPIGRQRSLILPKVAGQEGATLTVSAEFPEGADDDATTGVTLERLQVFRIKPGTRPDAWMIVGASINQAAFAKPDRFWSLVRERHPEADPLLVRMAVGGWITRNAIDRGPEFLRRHPEVRTVMIHIGGNDVSRHRPYPSGADNLRADLTKLVDLLKGDGRQVYLSRLSYRAYKNRDPVPPESNGSLPYNLNVYDPLIRKACPTFIDNETGLGRMDPYSAFRDHPEELKPDGVHNLPAGSDRWLKLWIDAVGPLVYPTAPGT